MAMSLAAVWGDVHNQAKKRREKGRRSKNEKSQRTCWGLPAQVPSFS